MQSSPETETLKRVFDRISTRLNDVLCEMKPDYDDSIVGFNEAWDIMRAVFKDELAKADGLAPTPREPLSLQAVREDERLACWKIADKERTALKNADPTKSAWLVAFDIANAIKARGYSDTSTFRRCDGCDGHECDNGCAYPGVQSSPERGGKMSRTYDWAEDKISKLEQRIEALERQVRSDDEDQREEARQTETREQIISDFQKFRLKVWEKASSYKVRGHVEVWKHDSDLLEDVAGLLASLSPTPQESADG